MIHRTQNCLLHRLDKVRFADYAEQQLLPEAKVKQAHLSPPTHPQACDCEKCLKMNSVGLHLDTILSSVNKHLFWRKGTHNK